MNKIDKIDKIKLYSVIIEEQKKIVDSLNVLDIVVDGLIDNNELKLAFCLNSIMMRINKSQIEINKILSEYAGQ